MISLQACRGVLLGQNHHAAQHWEQVLHLLWRGAMHTKHENVVFSKWVVYSVNFCGFCILHAGMHGCTAGTEVQVVEFSTSKQP